MESGGESGIVPQAVVDGVKRSLVDMEELRLHLSDFLALSEPEVLAQLPPLSRAQSFLLLSKAASALYTLRLRSHGIHPDEHSVKSELERSRLYEEKLERFIALSKAPLRPSTKLNFQAATRFIEHSLPDLTTEQRQSMREMSRGEGVKSRSTQKKRKYQSSERQSVRSAAQEFLEKAKQELLGVNNGDLKGPLRIHSSDEED